MALTGVGPVVA
jgi:hypothetical protein